MPKTKSNLGSSITRWVRCNKKFQITQHVTTEFHLKCLKKSSNNSKQMLLGDETKPKTSSFNEDLCLSLVAANIPWFKLQNPVFRDFLQNYTKKHIPDESTLLGVLNEQNASKPFLISCKKLDKINHSTISRFVNDSLRILWSRGGNDEKVLILCSDAAPYIIKAGKTLNVFFPNMIHISLAHMIQRLAEKVREMYLNVNTLVSNLKKVFLKAPQRVNVYKEIMPSVPLPPVPVLTRWGTWVETANFCADHFDNLKIILQKLEDKNVVSIQKCINMLSLESVKSDLTFIQSHFFILVKSIKNLEHSSLTLSDSSQIVNNVILAMEKVPGQKGKIIQEKLFYLIEKNVGFQTAKQITTILPGKENSHQT
ncbi:Ribonuclease H-like domain [Cinara cedri]|uniref:Ribonuclease H-like domain n=1 Tax=Cinara cedri TaxID=506608 RepID=A0A5E4MTW1_9HEMI|nr:Ribonuclease H-like domain [Cinara cedri]